MGRNISRRSFLQNTAVSAAALSISSSSLNPVLGKTSSGLQAGPGNKWPGRVVINYNKNVSNLGVIDTEVAKKMIDDSVLFLSGKTTPGEAWKEIFPSTLSAESTVAIKVPLGCAIKLMAIHWSTVKAIVDGLTQMDFNGTKFPAKNITIYERGCSDKFATFGYTAANFPGVTIVHDSFTEGSTDGANNLQYAKSLKATFLINVFRPGGHKVEFGGFTLGFKNHYGTYVEDHSSNAPKYLRDINCTGVVYNKNVLSVCVGLFGAKEIGMPTDNSISYLNYVKTMDPAVSGTEAPPSTIIMSTDPITAEMQAIKMMRLNNGNKYSIEDLPSYLKASGGVAGALPDKVYNIGIIDELKMDILKIINGEKTGTGIRPAAASGAKSAAGLISVTHLQKQRIAHIDYCLPKNAIGSQATIDIFDLKGQCVFSVKQTVAGLRNQFTWDEKNGNSIKSGAGVYLVRITAAGIQLSEKVHVSE